MIYKRIFKEEVLSAVTEFDTSDPTDQDILRIAISAEQSAITLYNKLSKLAQNEQLKRVLLDISKEEKVHIGEFQELLKQIDEEESEALLDGAEEISDI